jgi:CheY-like chemotaxis protein
MSKAGTGVPTGGLRLLVLDDDHDCTDKLAKLLTDWGHEVCTAYDGQTAIELARIWRPHVAFVDLQMPGMDGWQVAECLRRQAASKNTVLVAMADRAELDNRRRCSTCGFAHRLSKPTKRQDVCDLMRTTMATMGQDAQKEKRTGKMPLPARADSGQIQDLQKK